MLLGEKLRVFVLFHQYSAVALRAARLEAQSGRYYGAVWGNDTNPGTYAEPWKTVQRAADLAEPGDTIYVRHLSDGD